MRLIVSLLFIFFYFKAFSQLPVCKDSFPKSLLPNHSFEKYSGCFTADYGGHLEGGVIGLSSNFGGISVPGWTSVFRTGGINYHNYNCRLFDSSSIFNPAIYCHSYAKVPLPLPDSSGFIRLFQGLSSSYAGTDESVTLKDYLTTCLPEPLYAGQPYTFSFYFGFGKSNTLKL